LDLLQAVILGAIQGATEFVPVSSSGHLVLVPWLLHWPTPGLVFDTMVHWGTLAAIVLYFRKEWWRILAGGLSGLAAHDWHRPEVRLLVCLVIGSIPAAVLGLLLEDWFESLFLQPVWVSLFLLVTAAVLVSAERLFSATRSISDLGWRDALLIGVGQAVAIVPGISRSGATISAGLMRGLSREEAARFGFLLGTPAILGAGMLQLRTLVSESGWRDQLPTLGAGFLAAAITGYLCVWGLLRFLSRRRLYPFAAYCALFGLLCLTVAWLR